MPWFLEKDWIYILLVVFKSVEQNMTHNQNVCSSSPLDRDEHSQIIEVMINQGY